MSLASFSSTIIEFAIGNLAIALPLGLLAWWLQRRRAPFLAHLVWLVVLVKLVTPPLYSLRIEALSEPGSAAPNLPDARVAGGSAVGAPDPAWAATLDWQVVAAGLWLAGSALVLAWTVARACRFHRLLQATSEPAAPGQVRLASQLAATLGLRKAPPVMVTAARISPMVWWIGGPVRIYIPRSMIREMSHAELRDILAHELGHVGRRDHYVRWLECLVGVVHWWNPVAWWARRNLRTCEEICCDACVLSKTEATRDGYAGALVSAMELLAAPTIRPSGMASHVNGGFIERRIRMILSGQTVPQTPRWVRGLVLIPAALLLPLGFTLAQDSDSDDLERVREWLESGVNSAFLTQEQADIMLGALRASQRGVMTVVDSDGNILFHQHSVPRIALQAERVRLDPATGDVQLDDARIEVTEPAADQNFVLDAVLGELVVGRRVVKVDVLPAESPGDFRIVRQFDDATTETELVRGGEAE